MNADEEILSAKAPLDVVAFATAAAVLSALIMLVLGIFGAVGVYEGAVSMMEEWHLFFRPTVGGTVAGMLEAAIVAWVVAYAFAWTYNTLART